MKTLFLLGAALGVMCSQVLAGCDEGSCEGAGPPDAYAVGTAYPDTPLGRAVQYGRLRSTDIDTDPNDEFCCFVPQYTLDYPGGGSVVFYAEDARFDDDDSGDSRGASGTAGSEGG